MIIELEFGKVASKIFKHDGERLIIFAEYDRDDSAENPLEWGSMGMIHSLSSRHRNYYKGDPIDLLRVKECESCKSDLLEHHTSFSELYREQQWYKDEITGYEQGLELDGGLYFCSYCGFVGNWESAIKDTDAVPLSYFEHGQCRWGVHGTMDEMADFRWDGVSFAGVWEPDDDILEWAKEMKLPESGPERDKWFLERAQAACSLYTAWCNGDVYGYNISIYKLRVHENGTWFKNRLDYRYDEPVYDDSCWGFFYEENIQLRTHRPLGAMEDTMNENGLDVYDIEIALS